MDKHFSIGFENFCGTCKLYWLSKFKIERNWQASKFLMDWVSGGQKLSEINPETRKTMPVQCSKSRKNKGKLQFPTVSVVSMQSIYVSKRDTRNFTLNNTARQKSWWPNRLASWQEVSDNLWYCAPLAWSGPLPQVSAVVSLGKAFYFVYLTCLRCE